MNQAQVKCTPAKPLEWSDLWSAMRAAPERWILTTETMFYERLCMLPPAAQSGAGFLVGEANRHNAEGLAVYAAFVEVDGKHYARYLTHNEFKTVTVAGLREALARTLQS